jgi:hypothetical protein
MACAPLEGHDAGLTNHHRREDTSMMRITVFLIALAASAGCRVAPPPSAPAAASPDPDEAAVYAVVIDSVFAKGGAPFVVLGDSTATGPAGEVERVVLRRDPGFPAAAIADFEARNRTPVPIPQDLPARTPIRLLRMATFRLPSGNLEESYAKFRRDFAPATHFYLVSRPGFDAERRRAVIPTGSACGSLCGRGEVLLLVRGEHGWQVTFRTMTWIS